MKLNFKFEQLGVAVTSKLDHHVEAINKLDPDLVQLQMHLGFPSIDACKAVTDKDTQLIAKFILPMNQKGLPVKFVEDSFRRFKDVIKIYDFGGEPEIRPWQQGCRFDGTPEEFVKLTKGYYEIGKSINPDNIIGGCGWLTPTFNGYFGNEDRSEFFKSCCELGIGDYLDFISLNFYLYGYGGTKNIYVGCLKVSEILARYGIDKPVVVSECGVPCAGDPRFYHIIQTEERQAISLVEQHILFNSMGIDYAIWFALKYNGWGLLDESGKPRLSYKAFKGLGFLLKGAEYVKQFKALPSTTVQERWLTDKFNWHVFEDGSEIHVIWLSGGAELVREYQFDFPIYDMYGQRINVATGKVTLDAHPIYIVATPGAIHPGNFGRK